jgi:polysaccharide biosynthesis protein PelE
VSELLLFLGLDALASAAAALLLLRVLPPAQRGKAPFLLFFAIGFFVPLLGVLGILAVAHAARRAAPRPPPSFELHAAPVYDPLRGETIRPRSKGGVRVHLADVSVPTEARLRALLTVQSMPARAANPLIREMLSDPAEDLRLIAYGILDAREKAINAQIQAARARAEEAQGAERAGLEKRLAQLYSELVYQGLVQGELREHSTAEAAAHLAQALMLDAADPALDALLGQLALDAGETGTARSALERALERGYPESRVLPYLAEIAFRTRRFDEVRAIARRLAPLPNTQRLEQVVDYWKAA